MQKNKKTKKTKKGNIMTDLTKIANSEELTYLQKVAAIVDEFAAGNVDGETADAIAQEAGISPEDLLAMHNAVYGEGEIEKTASEEGVEDLAKEAADHLVKVAESEDATYLEKCAGIADAYAAGAVTAEEGDQIAEELGLSPEDVASVFVAAYGEPESEGEMEKTAAAEDAIDFLVKVAESEDATYLEKCAGVADAYMADALNTEEAVAVAGELGLDPADVDSVIEAAYGDVLEKEAKYGSETAKKIWEGAKTQGKKAVEDMKNIKHAIGSTKGTGKDGKILKGDAERIKKIISGRRGAGYVAGGIGAVGATGYGASKLFGKKDEK